MIVTIKKENEMSDVSKYFKPTPEIPDYEFEKEKTDSLDPLPTIPVDKEKFLEICNKWMVKYSNLVHLLAADNWENYDEQNNLPTL